ncbi:MAG: hypothetical protein OXU92_09500 [Deltaproteobacteria bacterium]|nr:hypothetical protein [Deltaproteobacteria bacterium]
MLILAVANHLHHDSAAVVAQDYQILSAVQTERLTRMKGDGQCAHQPTITEALRIAGASIRDVDALLVSPYSIPVQYFDPWSLKRSLSNHFARRVRGRIRYAFALPNGARYREVEYKVKFIPERFLKDLGLREDCEFFFYEHHFSHALSALFFTDYENALIYTADGGGDFRYYSAHYLSGATLRNAIPPPPPRGRWRWLPKEGAACVGLAYRFMTEALGYTPNRHEGKLTGLAAYGEPEIYDEIRAPFRVLDDGQITSELRSGEELKSLIFSAARRTTPQNAAASVQKLLEDLILSSIGAHLRRSNARQVALAGGVFANVTLNRRIAELPGVQQVFIFPGMGDEGLAVGGLYQYLLERDGLQHWLAQRRPLADVYWGGAYDAELPRVFADSEIERLPGTVAETTAQLLQEGEIVALFNGRMEFGPRALGARSILASPAQQSVNNTLNARLERTEFMPFAPCVLEEDADEVFEVTDANRYAMRFMTITCQVRKAWRARIPAVVHVDGTARPQIVREEWNPLYAQILRCFKQRSGLPVLVNTSFNAHEEPIIHTPAECLRALRGGRVDYVAAESGVYRLRQTKPRASRRSAR